MAARSSCSHQLRMSFITASMLQWADSIPFGNESRASTPDPAARLGGVSFRVSAGFATGIGEHSAAELPDFANFLADVGESTLAARLAAMID